MFIRGVAEGEAHGEVAEYYEAQRAMWGFLPNYAAPFSHRPEVGQAWQALNLAIRGGMDRRRYEIATIAASRARRSTYCTVAHSMFLRDVCGDSTAMVGADPAGASVSDDSRPQDPRRMGATRVLPCPLPQRLPTGWARLPA